MTFGTWLLYGTMRTLAVLACRLPRRWGLAAADAFAAAVWTLYRLTPVRSFVPGNVAAAFPQWPRREALRVGARSLALLARAIVEVMRFPLFVREGERIVRLADREHLDRALARGRGAIVATAHYGNWELLGASLARWFAPLAVLVQTPSKDVFARLLAEYRRMVGVETYSNSGPQALRPVLRALRRGEIVGLLCDQHGEAREGRAVFFGHRVWVPLGPFSLARRTGAPVVPARLVREEGDRHVLVFAPPLPVSNDPDANAQALASLYEQWIRERPDHWLWPHNRFEQADPPDGGFASWFRAIALALSLVGSPAHAAPKPVILAMPDRLEVLDTASPDTHGAIPLPGRAEVAHFVASREVLVVHMPGAGALSLVDLKPFSPFRYQAFQTFRAPELAAYDLGMEEAAGQVLLGYAKTPIAVLDIGTWRFRVGFDRPDAIPFPFSNAKVLYLPAGVFTLRDGQVVFESTRLRPQHAAATPVSLEFRAQPTAMVAGPIGRHLYVALGGPGGKGVLSDVEAETRRIRRELTTPGPLGSLVWVDDRTLAVLSGEHLGLVDVPRWRLSRWFRLELPGGPPLRLLPAHVPRAPEPRF